ncbi:PocR ligand-binding domain-containing protein [Candidatus Peregrinibacteria bacterium]|nr:PocR ligand-binding domain-containing protein [Candidatus Peregrinibacteria bacterium]
MGRQRNLTDLVSARTLEKIQDNFSVATGMSCVIYNEKGTQVTRISNPSKLWQKASTDRNIAQNYRAICQKAFEKCAKTGQVQIINAYLDCFAFVVPIYFEGMISGFAVGGLTRYGNPSKNLCVEESLKLSIDIDTFLDMYWALPIVTEEKLEACANLFKHIATTISQIAKEGSEAKQKVQDVTEINELLEQEIHQSEERYKKLFETINDGVYFANQEGICTEINKAGANLLGYEPEELIGSNLKNIYVNPEDRQTFINQLQTSGHIENFHPFIRTKNGETKYFETNAVTITDKNGTIIGVQGIFRNIDHRLHNILKHDTSQTFIPRTQNNQVSPQKT